MTHNKLFEVLRENVPNSEELINIIDGFKESSLGGYIARETISMLSDQHYKAYCISDFNLIALTKMVKRYIDTCWRYLEDVKDFEKYLRTSKMLMYKMNVDGELRYATVNEIEQGVEDIIGEYNYPIGEDKSVMLSIMMWMFTGDNKYITQAGFRLHYSEEERKYTDTLYEKIYLLAGKMNEVFDWVEGGEFEGDIATLKKLSKNKFKYAKYASNEVVEDIEFKQVAFDVLKCSCKNISKEVSRAYILCKKYINDKVKLEPLEKAFIRKQYKVIKETGSVRESEDKQPEEISELRKMCEDLLALRSSGRIAATEFVFKIIQSLMSNGYRKVSPKQFTILQEAYNKYIGSGAGVESKSSNKASNETAVTVEEDTMLIDMSDMLGSGNLD